LPGATVGTLLWVGEGARGVGRGRGTSAHGGGVGGKGGVWAIRLRSQVALRVDEAKRRCSIMERGLDSMGNMRAKAR
jgi:hypothetical protein